MADIDVLAGELETLFLGVGRSIVDRFEQEDKDDLADYAKNIATLTFELRTTTDPAGRRQITDNIATFSNAANLMVARYEIIAAGQLEKASLAALKIAVDVVTKVLIAAL
jgi:hypothetical protein